MQFEFILNVFGIFNVDVTPINIEGDKDKPMKFMYGNQFQYWEKTRRPVTAYNFGIPDLVVKEIFIFLPPISSMPIERIAPSLVI